MRADGVKTAENGEDCDIRGDEASWGCRGIGMMTRPFNSHATWTLLRLSSPQSFL